MFTVNDRLYFPSLTAIRAIAAYMVFMAHFNPFYETSVYTYVSKFYVGVTLFFVLSGFLITYKYYDNKKFNLKEYIYNRFIRIYPLFFLIVTATLLLRAVFQGYDDPWQFLVIYLMNITFLKGFFWDYFFSGLMQGWSLTVEETFYLMAPFLFFLIKKTKLSFLILPLFFVATGLLLVSIFSKIDFYGFFGNYRLMFSGTFFGRCIDFFCGMYLAVLVKENRFIKIKLHLTYIGLVSIAVCIYLIPLQDKITAYQIDIWHLISSYLLLPISVVVFYYGLLSESTFITKLLSNKLFVLLGKSSYAFYLIHIGYLSSLIKVFTSNFLISFLITNVAALLIYLIIEKPIHTYLKFKWKAV